MNRSRFRLPASLVLLTFIAACASGPSRDSGPAAGTVSRGGDLWRADLETLERKPIVQIKSGEAGFEEIVAFEFVPGHKLIRYVLARYDEYGEPTFRPRYCVLDGNPVE